VDADIDLDPACEGKGVFRLNDFGLSHREGIFTRILQISAD
jgi:hypothetical protein